MSTTTSTRTRRNTTTKQETPMPETKATETKTSKPATSGEKDYTYLADKLPTELHEAMAAWITEVTGVKVTPKQAQVVSVLRQEFHGSQVHQTIAAKRRKDAEKREAEKTAAKKAAAAKKIEELQALLDS